MARCGAELLPADGPAQFARAGFVCAPGFLAPREVEGIARWIDELAAAPEIPGRQWMYFEPSTREPGKRLLNRIENFAPFHASLGALIAGEPLVGAVSALFGEPAVLFKDKINFKQPGGGGFEPHQDSQAGWNRYASLFITAAIAIDAATPENGCLELVHWRHRRELIGPLWEPLGAEHLKGVEFAAQPMQPGDAAFFDSYLPHRSGPNHTAQGRRVLYVTYNRVSEGDQRARYYADKHASYPPDCERETGRQYAYRV